MKENCLWKYQRLPAIEHGKRPKVLLVGNGLNRKFGMDSWEDLICNALARNKSLYAYDDIKDMTATMQIVVATSQKFGSCQEKNSIIKEVQNIAKRLRVTELKSEQSELIGAILDLPADVILNTNYSNEFELFATKQDSLHCFRSVQRRTKPVKGIEEQFRLFQFSSLGKEYPDKSIWHIHGDISKPSTMIIGHYYYGKLLKQIEERAASCVRSYNIANAKKDAFTPQSWVDYFLLGDVYVLGFGMSLAEQDLWWLLSFKEKHFADTKVFFFEAEKTINKDVKKLLCAYGVEPVTDTPLQGDDYLRYYHIALAEMKDMMNK